jgi:hypothetical protein
VRPLSPARHLGLLEHHTTYAKLVRDFAFSCLRGTKPREAEGEKVA